MKKLFLALIILLLSALPAFAEDLYVGQSTAGDDSGASCANQKAASWFNTAGSWGAGAGKISAGDTVHLCGTIATNLTAQGSGSAGNLITILWETDAKISLPYCAGGIGQTIGCFATLGNTYLVLDGGTNGIIEANDNGTTGTYSNQQSNYGIGAPGCDNCEIKNLHIHNLYRRTSTSDYENAGSFPYTRGIYFNGSNVSIHDNVLHDIPGAIGFDWEDGDDEVRVYNNEMYNCGHNFFPTSGGHKHLGKLYFYNNYVHDYAVFDDAAAPTCNYHHNSAIHAYGVDVGGVWPDVQEFWIYNNRFTNPGLCPTAHVFLEGGAQSGVNTPWTGATGKAYVFNNLVIGTDLQVWKGSGHVFYNNTVINGSIRTDAVGSPQIKNNYISGGGASNTLSKFIEADLATTPSIDYNIYANTIGNETNLWCWSTGNCTGAFDTYLANTTNDDHSINAAPWGGPPDTAGINQTTGLPSVGSDVIDHGVDLSGLSITALNSDRAGTARGASWDIGAYEYSGTTPTGTHNGISISGGVSFR